MLTITTAIFGQTHIQLRFIWPEQKIFSTNIESSCEGEKKKKKKTEQEREEETVKKEE